MYEFAGSGRGVQTRDGCSVEFYRKLPYMGELDPVLDLLPAGASVLELGCGTGRLTRVLLDRGLSVSAVDNSREMLASLPVGASAVHANIEDLALPSKFDVILMASHLINHPIDELRRSFVRCAFRHAHRGSRILLQRHDNDWLENVAPGFEIAAGELSLRVESVERDGTRVSIALSYTLDGEVWRQSFAAALLSDAHIESLLAEERLVISSRIGPKQSWIVAQPA